MKTQGIKGLESLLRRDDIDLAKQTHKKIPYTDLISHKKNHYGIRDVEELADLIEDLGLLQEVLVKPMGEQKYKIVSGHRRCAAIQLLVEERGLEKFKLVDCKICERDEDEDLTEYKLHASNSFRDFTEHEKMIRVSELKSIIQRLKDKGFILKGKMKDIIADDTGLSPTQVQRYITLGDHADDEIKEKLKNQEISMIDAYNSTVMKKNSDLKTNEKEVVPKTYTNKRLINSLRIIKKYSDEIQNSRLIDMIQALEDLIKEIGEEEV